MRWHRAIGLAFCDDDDLWLPNKLESLPVGADMVAAYRRLEHRLRAMAAPGTALVSCHPVLAAVADPRGWEDVVYFGWDDWCTKDGGLFSRAGGAMRWSYQQMAERDVNVVTVSQTIANRIGAPRSTVVPSGVEACAFDAEVPVPEWFASLPGPVALWVGAVEGRIDTLALADCARALGPEWTVVLVGPVVDPLPLQPLRGLPNVVMKGWHPRPEVLGMIKAARVCLLPHVATPSTEAMSPLKVYEYLAAGRPIVASDLPPVRGISDRIVLVPPGGSVRAGRADGLTNAGADVARAGHAASRARLGHEVSVFQGRSVGVLTRAWEAQIPNLGEALRLCAWPTGHTL